MRFYKLILCIVLLFSILFGCSNSNTDIVDETTPTQINSPEPEQSVSPDAVSGDFDYEKAYAAIEPDTVMLSAGDYDVTWSELFFYICSSVSYLNNSGGFSWSDEAGDGLTYAELIMSYATDDALSYKAILYGADRLGITLDDADYAEIEANYQSAVESLGGEEELMERLRNSSHIYSRDLFYYLLETDMLVSKCYSKLFGDDMSLVTDEAAADQTALGGYLMAKHILRLKTDDGSGGGDNSVPLSEAEDILEKLDDYSGDDLDGYFTELMNEHSEDTGGLSSYPGGYLFQYGDMVPEFYEACVALDIGDYSGIVETTYGYHIIYRLPIDYDIVPFAYYSQGYNSSLRQIAASELFNLTISDWVDELSVSYKSEYDSLSLPELFTPLA